MKRKMKGGTLFVLEVVAVVAVVVVAALSILAFRLHVSPLDVGFAKDTIEEQLNDQQSGISAKIGNITLSWPDLSGPLYLWANNVRLVNAADDTVLTMDQVALSVAKSRLIFGQVYPLALIIKEPELQVVRDKEGNFDIGFGALQSAGQLEIENDQRTLTERLLAAVSSSEQQSVLSSLRVFDVRDALVNYTDEETAKGYVLKGVSFRVARDKGALDMMLSVSQGDTSASANIIIPRDGQAVSLAGKIENMNVPFLAQYVPQLAEVSAQDGNFDGEISGFLDGNFVPDKLNLDIRSAEGQMVVPDYYPDGFSYKNFILSAEYGTKANMLMVKKAHLEVGGVPIEMDAELVFNDDEFTGPMGVQIASVEHAQIEPLWPSTLKDDSSHEWVVEKISDATFTNAQAGFFLRATQGEEGWDIKTENLLAEFDFSGATVNYREPLMPVKEGKGHGKFSLDQERLDVAVKSGKLGDIDVLDGDLIFADIIEAGQGDADVKVKLAGPLATVFRFVEDEPIGAKHGMDTAKVKGQAEMDIRLQFPTKADVELEEFKIGLTGKVTDAQLPGVVKDLTLVGGPFDVAVKNNLLSVKGKGALDGRDITAEYKEYLVTKGQPYKSQITASIIADPALRTKFGIDLSDFIEGSAPVNVVYTDMPDGSARADVDVDATTLRLFVDAFKYEKPVSVPASASVQANLKNQELQNIRGLTVKAPDLSIAGGELEFKKEVLSGGKIPSYSILKSKGSIDFEIGAGGAQKIAIGGDFLDLRSFLEEEKEPNKVYNEPPRKISVAVKAMQASEAQTMRNGKLYIDIDGQGVINQFEMDAAAGEGDIYLRFKVDNSGKRTFRMEAGDAGATLRALDLYDKMRGGKLVIYGEPMRGIYDRNLSGTAEISNFRVVKAPALAKLLSVMSLPGIMQLLNNEGLVFSRLETKFNWLYRKEGSLLVLQDGRTSGNSVGLTFEGKIDQAADTMDVSGTIVPLSGLNEIVSNIPLVGQILSGGTGSIFAATYTMRGQVEDPKVEVNPLSVLTPGLIRRILFEN